MFVSCSQWKTKHGGCSAPVRHPAGAWCVEVSALGRLGQITEETAVDNWQCIQSWVTINSHSGFPSASGPDVSDEKRGRCDGLAIMK